MLSLIMVLLGGMALYWSWVGLLFYLIMVIFLTMKMFPLFFSFYTSFAYVDSLSFSLESLTIYLFVLMFLASQLFYKNSVGVGYYNLLLIFLLISLVLTFYLSSMILFYFSFEASLIPTFVLIFGWGVQPERLQASIYFFFYTLFMSLPLLLMMIYTYFLSGSFFFVLSSETSGGIEGSLGMMMSIFFGMAFFIKLPLFLFHLWLPKAHVEAPVSGSMVLAGVLLKLGGYGLCRVYNYVLTAMLKWGCMFFSLGLVCTIYVGFMCCRMNDMKALIAYSSVAHMGLLICSLSGYFLIGFLGCVLVMISHGITSSGLFAMVNLFYERVSSRSVYISKGLVMIFPSLSLFVFLMCISNFSTPPFINLISEIYIIFSMMGYSMSMMFIFPLGSFLGTAFCVGLYSYTQHGLNYSSSTSLGSVNFLEYHMLVMHVMPLMLLPYISVKLLMYI